MPSYLTQLGSTFECYRDPQPQTGDPDLNVQFAHLLPTLTTGDGCTTTYGTKVVEKLKLIRGVEMSRVHEGSQERIDDQKDLRKSAFLVFSARSKSNHSPLYSSHCTHTYIHTYTHGSPAPLSPLVRVLVMAQVSHECTYKCKYECNEKNMKENNQDEADGIKIEAGNF